MKLTYQYEKKRGRLGRQPMFCEQGPALCDSITPDPQEQKHYILRNPVHAQTQNTPAFSECYINTISIVSARTGVEHKEGGWAKDININDEEATHRYRRKIEREDPYIRCVHNLSPNMEYYVLQNNAVDIYGTYYSDLPKTPARERVSCQTINVFRDQLARPITSICWQPKGHVFSTCYVDVDFYRTPRKPTQAYLWDVEYPHSPDTSLYPSAPMFDLQFNPLDKETLVGGLATGQVVIFDIRAGSKEVLKSPMHVAHRDLVKQVLFIHSKSGKEFFSAGPDGVCKWWDPRQFDKPTDEIIIDLVKTATDEPNMATAYGVSVIEYEPTIPTRFTVGTENGMVIVGNHKGKTHMEKLPVKFNSHVGCVASLERHPVFSKNFLTVGDWTAKIWADECRDSAILWTPALRHKVCCGSWSPTKISLVTLCGADGVLSIYDFLQKQHEPILTTQLCKDSLLVQKFHHKGSLLAIGNSKGVVTLTSLSEELVYSGANDKVLFAAVLEQQSKRERILEARMREIKLKLKHAGEGSVTGSLAEFDPTLIERDLTDATTDYMAAIKKELALFTV